MMIVRKSCAVLATAAAALLAVAPALAAPALTGPVACEIPASNGLATITPPLPAVTPITKGSKLKITSDIGTCVGENPALAIARVSVTAGVRKASTCATEFSEAGGSSLHWVNPRIKIIWIGRDGEHFGGSTARLASAVIQETPTAYVLTMVSEPIGSRPFRGEMITVDASISNLADLATQCTSPTGAVSTIEFRPVFVHVQ